MPGIDWRLRERPLAIGIAVTYAIGVLAVGSLSLAASDRSVPPFEEWPESAETELYERILDPLSIAVLAVDFDPETMLASFRLLPQPIGDLGGSLGPGSAWWLDDIDLELVVNSVRGLDDELSTVLYFEGHPEALIPYASIETQIDSALNPGFRTRPATRWYPFDSYAFDLTVLTSQRSWSEQALSPSPDSEFLLGWSPLAVAPYSYSAPLGGYDFSFRPGSVTGWEAGQTADVETVLAEWQEGAASFEVYVTRTPGIKLLVALISLTLFLNLLAVLYLTARVVSTERPPSAQVLIWFAALSFAAVAIRDTMPAAPPPGIMLDYLFFFPTLLVSAGATVILVLTWSRRPDYVA